MACSCKSKKVNAVYIPSVKYAKQVVILQHESDSSQLLNFSANTKPDLLCINCIKKHISFAIALLLYLDLLSLCIAVGLLRCAADHIRHTVKLIAWYILRMGYLLLQYGNKNKVSLKLQAILKDKDFFNKIPYLLPRIPSIKHYYILTLAQTYSLLFTLISYLDVNKLLAIGQLVKAAHILIIKDKSIALHIRLIWKMIQDMTPYDLLYKKARKLLLQVILQVKHIVDLMSDSKSNTQETV